MRNNCQVVLEFLLEILFPKKCVFCKTSKINENGLFCSDCWVKLDFVSAPYCQICSAPFEFKADIPNMICGKCIQSSPHFDSIRFLLKFDNFSKKIIYNFKYGDKTHLAKPLAKMICSRYTDYIQNADFIIFVPMHWIKRCLRFYNQSALLARAIAKITKQSIYYDILIKTKWTKPQSSLKAKQREQNLSGSIIVNKDKKDFIKGKKILLIDDVVTTGATLAECSKLLKAAGAKSVSCLTICSTAQANS